MALPNRVRLENHECSLDLCNAFVILEPLRVEKRSYYENISLSSNIEWEHF